MVEQCRFFDCSWFPVERKVIDENLTLITFNSFDNE